MTELPNKRIRSFKKEKQWKVQKERAKKFIAKSWNNKKGLYYCIVEVKKNKDTKQIILHKQWGKSYIWLHY